MIVFAVFLVQPDGTKVLHSAWPDVYHARFEARRWEENDKKPYVYEAGQLILSETPQTTSHPEADLGQHPRECAEEPALSCGNQPESEPKPSETDS